MLSNENIEVELDERQKIIAMTLKVKVDIFKLKLKKKKLYQEIYRAYFEGLFTLHTIIIIIHSLISFKI